MSNSSLNAIQLERQKARDSFHKVNDNIQAAEGMKIAILKGMKCGESAELLLLDAAKCISLLTGDCAFHDQLAEDLKIRHQLEDGELTHVTMETQHRLHLMKRCIEKALQQYNER